MKLASSNSWWMGSSTAGHEVVARYDLNEYD